jgi:DNA helicase-2/ATP-dependent DNA helicase PcrA
LRQFLDPVLCRRYDHAESRLHDLEELEHLALGYGNRAQLVAELVLDPPAATSDLAGPPSLEEDYLVLSTVHSAKGGEWDAVHVIHAADGMFPSDLATRDPEEIDEERRLFYVALTRARDHLHVYFPLRYFHRRVGYDDRHHYGQLTRFLPPVTHDLFERHHPAARTDDAVAVAGRPTTPLGVDVDRALEALWQ